MLDIPEDITQKRGRPEVTDTPPAGTVFTTFHFAEAAASLLTNPALDPVAKIPEYKYCAVKVEGVEAAESEGLWM